MGGLVSFQGKKIKFWKVNVLDKESIEFDSNIDFENIDAGTVVMSDAKKGLFVKTVDGKILSILEIQGENAKRMNIGDFLRGNSINVLDKFE
jgi:methionyl-tRNA formyltransferase